MARVEPTSALFLLATRLRRSTVSRDVLDLCDGVLGYLAAQSSGAAGTGPLWDGRNADPGRAILGTGETLHPIAAETLQAATPAECPVCAARRAAAAARLKKHRKARRSPAAATQ